MVSPVLDPEVTFEIVARMSEAESSDPRAPLLTRLLAVLEHYKDRDMSALEVAARDRVAQRAVDLIVAAGIPQQFARGIVDGTL